jgi:steroid delta-isomerase
MTNRVNEHVRLFNDAVQRQEWTAFLATFTPDAVMTFDGVPVGPYTGLTEITAAYATRPPTDIMSVGSVTGDGDTDVIRFSWDAGGSGTMRLTWRAEKVAALTVSFDRGDGA